MVREPRSSALAQGEILRHLDARHRQPQLLGTRLETLVALAMEVVAVLDCEADLRAADRGQMLRPHAADGPVVLKDPAGGHRRLVSGKVDHRNAAMRHHEARRGGVDLPQFQQTENAVAGPVARKNAVVEVERVEHPARLAGELADAVEHPLVAIARQEDHARAPALPVQPACPANHQRPLPFCSVISSLSVNVAAIIIHPLLAINRNREWSFVLRTSGRWLKLEKFKSVPAKLTVADYPAE